MLVSIIIPCYNNSATIVEAMDSAVQQSHKECEIIVVNDGSKDNSEEVIKNYVNGKNNITYYAKGNGGPSSTRNYGAFRAKGDYLIFLDGDDKLHPDYIKKCLEIYNAKPKTTIVYSQAEFFGDKTGLWKLPDFTLSNFLVDNCIPIFAMIRRDLFVKVGGFDEHLKFIEDWDLWISLLSENGVKVHRLNETLYYYRKSNTHTSLTQQNDDSDNTISDQSRLYIYQKHYHFFCEHNASISVLMTSTKYKKKYYNTWYRKLMYQLFKPKKYHAIYKKL